MSRKTILISLSLLALSACASHFSPYKMEVRQGNFITPEMREKLKLGMSKQQVRYVLGTPLLSDAFHGDRWDYPYSLAKGGKVVEHQAMTLYFSGDNLVRIDDAAMPALPPAVAVEEPVMASAVAVVPVVAEAAPAAVPVPATAAATVAVNASVQAWAAAWAARDSKTYLAAYSAAFHAEGMSRKAWQKQREQRLAKAHHITVELHEVAVQLRDATHASASFAQDYRSDAYHDSTRKTLQLEQQSGTWLIVAETIDQ